MSLSPVQVMRLAQLQGSVAIFEQMITALYRQYARPGDTVVDGGALVGEHSRKLAEVVGPAGHVLAFEPVPASATYLRALMQDLPQVEVIEQALAEHRGAAEFHVFPESPWYSSLADRFPWFDGLAVADQPAITRQDGRVIQVKTIALDDFADRPIRFIKLDLEGGEYHALRGAGLVVQKWQPVICLECAGAEQARVFGYTRAAFFELFARLDYKITDIYGRPYTEDMFENHKLSLGVPGYLVAYPAARGEVADFAMANAIAAAAA